MPRGAHRSRRDRRLRTPLRVLGCGFGDRADGGRADQPLSRAVVGTLGANGGSNRRHVGDRHRSPRRSGLAAAGTRRKPTSNHAGGSDRVHATGADPPAGACRGGGCRRLARCGARGGPDHRRAARKTRALRGVGISGSVGRGARGTRAKPPEPQTGADHLPARRDRLRRGVEQCRVPDLDGGGNPRWDKRATLAGTADVRRNGCGAASCGPHDS